MTPKVPAGADLKRSETGVSEKNLRCISGTSAFRISRYQHYWRRKTTFLSLLRTFLVVERNPLLKNCGFYPLDSCFPLFVSLVKSGERRPLRNRRTAEDFFFRMDARCAPCIHIFAGSDTVLLHRPAALRRRGIIVPRNPLAGYNARHLRVTLINRLYRRVRRLGAPSLTKNI